MSNTKSLNDIRGSRTIALVIALGIATLSGACIPENVASPNALNESVFKVDSQTNVTPGPQGNPSTLGTTPIGFTTYERSGEVVHPDVVTFPERWNGHRFWTVITPYPNSASKYENPSLYASNDGDHWASPAGVINPLATTHRGYLSDPDMVYVPERDELRLYYREVQNLIANNKPESHIADHVWMTTSKDATHWSAPLRVVSDTGKFVVSPSIVRGPNNDWRMYEIDSGRDGCSARSSRMLMRRSSDGVAWTTSSTVAFSQPGYVPWHLDVEYIPSRGAYYALIAAFPQGKSCMNTSLFLATSADGLQWNTYAASVLGAGEVPQFSSAVYRSSFSVSSDDSITIWFSGARQSRPAAKKKPAIFAWSAAVAHTSLGALFARVNDKSHSTPLAVMVGRDAAQVSSNIVP